jgi:hypothetical protein
MRRRTAIIGLAALLTAPALAHHGWSQYADDRPLTLTGTITESSYEFPHGTIRLQTDDKTWTVVLAPPSRMTNRGLAREALKPGAPATVMGYPHKTVGDELRAERITLNGVTTELR